MKHMQKQVSCRRFRTKISAFSPNGRNTIPIHGSAKRPRLGTIGKNHIQSSSCLNQNCSFVGSRYDTFLMNYSTSVPKFIFYALGYAINRVLGMSRTGIQGFLTKKVKSQQMNLFEHFKIEDTGAFVF